jgi:hypothetical protein
VGPAAGTATQRNPEYPVWLLGPVHLARLQNGAVARSRCGRIALGLDAPRLEHVVAGVWLGWNRSVLGGDSAQASGLEVLERLD